MKSSKPATTFICYEVDKQNDVSIDYAVAIISFRHIGEKTDTPQISGFATNLLLH